MTAATALLHGLSDEEAAARRARGEGNAVTLPSSRSYGRILRDNALTFVNVVLFIIAGLLLGMGLFGDALGTGALVLFNIIIGTVEEARAKRKLDQIALLVRPTATVIRGGQERTIDPAEIVVGDLLVARPGDQILVDGEIIGTGHLEVDESLLTGESDPVSKGPGDPVYSGTFCIAGETVYEAKKVGTASVANQLAAGVRAFRRVKTPLQRGIDVILRVALVITLLLGLLVASRIWLGEQEFQFRDSVRAAAVIVALVPQGLASMVFVSYALSAVRMAGKGILIQHANAIESLSHVNVLCLDKTGTLTSNRIRFKEAYALRLEENELRRRLSAFAASVGGGNRTIEALREALPGTPRPVATAVPFSSARKWSALVFENGEMPGLHVLGAPEVLRPHLQSATGLDDKMAEWTGQGLRVLLFAIRHQPPDALSADELPGDLEAAGLLSFSDELRPEAQTTLSEFAAAGIRLKIISGDNPDTVAALARQAGFVEEVRPVSGDELAALSPTDFARTAEDATVFGRITPQQKEALIIALRRAGFYVAMVGDGVNDVLALKRAQLAIALQSGSQAARSIADIVLMRDSFGVLPAMFREGQRIIRGMLHIMRLFLVRTLYVMLIIGGTALLNVAFPVTPRQNALLAILTVGIPTLALAAWAKPGPPRGSAILSTSRFVVPSALTATAFLLPLYVLYARLGHDVELARTVLTIAAALCGLLLILFVEPPSPFWVGGEELNGSLRPVVLAGAMLVLLGTILAVPVLRQGFELTTIRAVDLVIIEIVVVAYLFAVRWVWRARLFERFFGLVEEP